MATSTSQSAARLRPWYRLHASTWAVVGLVLALFVILSVPAYREIPRAPGSPRAWRGWPLVVVEQVVPTTRTAWLSNHVSFPVADDPARPQWLMASWWLYDGKIEEVSFSLWALVVDIVLALATTAVVAGTLEWRRRSGRSLWQFHVVELLVAILAAAVILGWYVNAKAGFREEQTVQTTWQAHYGDYAQPFAFESHVGPHWLMRLLGEGVCETFARSTEVSFHNYSDRDISSFAHELPRFHHLDQLELSECKNVGPIFAGVSRRAPLTVCDLEHSRITLQGLQELKRHAGVKYLRLENCQIEDNALSALVGLPRLEQLIIHSEALGDGNYRAIGRLAGLRVLWIYSEDLNDERLGQLRNLTSLEELELFDSAISDASLPTLSTFTHLKSLDLRETQVTVAGIAELKKSLPNTEIIAPMPANK